MRWRFSRRDDMDSGKPGKKKPDDADGKKAGTDEKGSLMSRIFGQGRGAQPIGGPPKTTPAKPAQVPAQPRQAEKQASKKPLFQNPFARKPVPAAPEAQSKPAAQYTQEAQPKPSEKPKPVQPQYAAQPAPVPKIPWATTTAPLGGGKGRAGKDTGLQAATRTRQQIGPSNGFKHLIEGIGAKHQNLDADLRKIGIKTGVYEFVKKMLVSSIILAVVVGGITLVLLLKLLPTPASAFVLAPLIGIAVFVVSFQNFIRYPSRRERVSMKSIERDILFAARDMIISLRSGMPLFNAITSVSTGYGDASREFLKVVEKVQLGVPLEDAIDETVEESKSPSFRKIMLQASVSIKVGADITAALQSVIDELSQERVIELRRYGQRLNAIAMFYMLFGIILPSMGIAVITILTTFIALFSVTFTLLEVGLVALLFMQIVFLQMIRTSRPVFTM
jgi:pilus assembly protein TadC